LAHLRSFGGIEGFVYGNISGGPRDARSRLKWIALQSEFKPQPYRQLAKVLGEGGDEEGAKAVLTEMERRQRGAGLGSLFMRWFVGYGYYPGRALVGLTILTGLMWVINRRAFFAGAMVPTDADAYKSYKEKGSPTPSYVGFSPFVYSLENSLPLVKLGQAERWQSDPNPQSVVRRGRKWMSHESPQASTRAMDVPAPFLLPQAYFPLDFEVSCERRTRGSSD
jgi:hypothetical protein